jgi:hypothetical protein
VHTSIVLLKDGEPTKCLASGNPQSTSPFPAFQTASNAYTSGELECFTVCLTMESDGHAMLGKDSVRDFSAAWMALSMIFKSRTFSFISFRPLHLLDISQRVENHRSWTRSLSWLLRYSTVPSSMSQHQ